MTKNKIKPGDRVTCLYRMPPEDQPWLHPIHEGTILALDDPRAWVGARVVGDLGAHVRQLLAAGLLRDRTPVLYAFGVRWDATSALRRVIDVTTEPEWIACAEGAA